MKDKVLRLVEQGQLKKALALMVSNDKIRDTSTLLLRRYNQNEDGFRKGFVNGVDRGNERTKIVSSLIQLLDEL